MAFSGAHNYLHLLTTRETALGGASFKPVRWVFTKMLLVEDSGILVNTAVCRWPAGFRSPEENSWVRMCSPILLTVSLVHRRHHVIGIIQSGWLTGINRPDRRGDGCDKKPSEPKKLRGCVSVEGRRLSSNSAVWVREGPSTLIQLQRRASWGWKMKKKKIFVLGIKIIKRIWRWGGTWPGIPAHAPKQRL